MSLFPKLLADLHRLPQKYLQTIDHLLPNEGEKLAIEVRQALSHAPETTDHKMPWRQTGVLEESISTSSTKHEVVIGSSSPVAVYQELGTIYDPPRPFLAPVAARKSEEIAAVIAENLESLKK